MNNITDWVESLEKLWKDHDFCKFAWKVKVLHNKLDDKFVYSVMQEFKSKIESQ